MSRYIFLSHSSVDREAANRLVKEFERRGISCWISSRDIQPGEDYQSAIVDALSGSAAMLLLFSTNANQSKEIAKELALASAERTPVIPARIEDILPTGSMKYQLTNAQFIDLFQDYNAALERLCMALRRQLDRDHVAVPRLPTAVLPGGPLGSPRIKWLAGATVGIALMAGTAWVVFPHKIVLEEFSAGIAEPHSTSIAVSNAEGNGRASPVQSRIAPTGSSPPVGSTPVPVSTPTTGALTSPNQALILPPVSRRPELSRAASDVVTALTALRPDQRSAAAPALLRGLAAPVTFGQVESVLQGVQYQSRATLLGVLSMYMEPGLSTEEGAQLLDGTGNSRLAALSTITPLLAKPQLVAGMVKLLGELQYAERIQGLKVLEPVMPGALSANDATHMLEGTGNSWLAGFTYLEPKLPTELRTAAVLPLVSPLAYNERVKALQLSVAHMTPGLSAEEGAQLLDGTGNSRLAALSTITPLLARPQSVAGMVKLLGGLQHTERIQGLKVLEPVMPGALSADDATHLLEGTGNSWLAGFTYLEPKLPTELRTAAVLPLVPRVVHIAG